MKIKWRIRTEVKWVVSLLGLCVLIAFAERQRGAIVCKDIVIQLDNLVDNHFLNEAQAMEIVESGQPKLRGKSFSDINLKEIENKLIYNKHVKDAELFSDLKGNLVVKVELRRPIARLVQEDGPDAYIAEDGMVMPVSENFATRVLIISGSYVKTILGQENLNNFDEGKQLMTMIEFINQDGFWRAQASQLDINSKGKVYIIPQVTSQIVEFGKPENIEDKFFKLKVFYKKILPQMGWNKYERVSLEYDGQVVAE
jgi:cell division protein FtsQ